MSVSLCIHGHFYQPPREDPWLGKILNEASAAPMRHWNERILRESYAPLAWARRLDGGGSIADVLNCYEWMSFNAGPTLLHWMRRSAPEVVARLRQADSTSKARWGHGNAMAQIYHHVIMPLATESDRALEVRWAIDDFRHHFGRAPEGMWLSECAVDLPSLESLAAEGISFVLLAPRQARAVVANGVATPVDEGSLDVSRSYRVLLPSGAFMTVLFYHGGLSQGIAFEGLLRDGELFWQRIAGVAGKLAEGGGRNPLLTIGTDGETYGHHFTFGEMALAHALAQGYAGRDNVRLTNLAAYIAANPPTCEVLLHEPSSWSCVHGVERWRSDCGCTDGGHGDWNQRWRGPLREALNRVRSGIEAHFSVAGRDCFTNARAALLDYGRVLADPGQGDAFAAMWFGTDHSLHDKAWKLLAMQEQSLAAFASCAWFFDDIDRIEPENGLTFALRALELVGETGGPDLRGPMLEELEKAVSNRQGAGTGKEIFMREVLPRRDDAASLCLLALLFLHSEGRRPEPGLSALYQWPRISVEIFPETLLDEYGVQRGRAIIRTSLERQGTRLRWRMTWAGSVLRDGFPFVSLADVSLTVWPEEGGDETAVLPGVLTLTRSEFSRGFPGLSSGGSNGGTTRSVREFSRPMRQFLFSQMAENGEYMRRNSRRAIAVHALSMLEARVEAQNDVPRPDFWNDLFPYIALESMWDDSLSDDRREWLGSLLTKHLSRREQTLSKKLIEDRLLEALAEGTLDDEGLALWVRRVRQVMPGMDWWAVQNAVWEQGVKTFPALAKELGFR